MILNAYATCPNRTPTRHARNDFDIVKTSHIDSDTLSTGIPMILFLVTVFHSEFSNTHQREHGHYGHGDSQSVSRGVSRCRCITIDPKMT